MAYGNAIRKRALSAQCIYCGERATSDEHFPPASVTPYGFILSACQECNSLAGTSFPYSMRDRAQHVKEKLAQRHAKAVKTAEFSSEDIVELDRTLASEVLLWQAEHVRIKARLAWCVESHLVNIGLVNLFAALNADNIFITLKESEFLPLTAEKTAKERLDQKRQRNRIKRRLRLATLGSTCFD